MFDGSEADHAALVTHKYNHQRSVEEFKIKEIKADRPLRRDPDFRAEWPWLQAVKTGISAPSSSMIARPSCSKRLRAIPSSFGFTEAEIVRFCFFRWYSSKYMQGPKQLKGV